MKTNVPVHGSRLRWTPQVLAFLLFSLLAAASASAQTFGTNYIKTNIGGINCSAVIAPDGTLYVGTGGGKLCAISPKGAVLWSFAAKGEIYATPAISPKGNLYMGSVDKNFYAVSSAGTQLWSFATGGSIYSSAALSADGHLYFGSEDGKLYALNSDGTLLWSYNVGKPIRSSPAIGADGTIYFGAYDGIFYALKPDGTKKWTYPTHGAIYSSPAIGADEAVYFGSRDGYLYALNNKGSNLWSFATQGEVNGSPTLGSDGSIYFGSDDSKFYALTSGGAKKWSYTTTRAIYSAATITAAGTLIFGSLDGSLYALKADSGAPVWTFATSGSIVSSPIINWDGSTSFGSHDGYFYQLKAGLSPAVSAWPMYRRNVQRTGSGFVQRFLPAGYSPGENQVVTLKVTPPAGTTVYSVQDGPPAGWTLGQISDNGELDSANWLVKFGPFFDDAPRVLTYEIAPPLNQTGVVGFSGWATADVWENSVGGTATQVYMPAHPADYNPVQGMVTINDLTAYGAAWKKGATWTVGPNPIPLDYVTRAALLWKGGEYYEYDSNIIAAPLWWVNTGTVELPVDGVASITKYPSGTSGHTNVATMADIYQPGQPMPVQLAVTPATNGLVYAVEDQHPDGWTISNISPPGEWDAVVSKVKWGPFFDDQPRMFSYTATPPLDATGIATFVGTVSIDGKNLDFDGQRRATDQLPIALLTNITSSPATGTQFNLQSAWGFNYLVQYSVDFTNWTQLTNLFSTNETNTVKDPGATNDSQRFYRAITQ